MEPSVVLSAATLTYPRSAREAAVASSRAIPLPGNDSGAIPPAVQSVSFSITAGERVGIIGRNGAGKSSLLSLIAGLMQPTSGEVSVSGHVTAVMTLGIGLREDFSGRENIYLDGELQGKPRAEVEQSLEEIIAFADIGQFIDYPLRTYSTGMKARLAFSMIINLDPEILIVDEALAVGDIDFVAKSSRKIKEICERGKIVILVSHSMQSIVDMCSRCLWLDGGRLIMDGNPAAVTAAYLDTVHREDEASLLERFRRHVGGASFESDCEIARLELFDMTTGMSRAVLLPDDTLSIRAELHIGKPLPRADVLLRIVRLDGLVLSENRLSDKSQTGLLGAPGRYTVQAHGGPCVLAAGVYEILLEIVDTARLVARRSTVFDVQVQAAPLGGRPALLYPWSLSAARKDNC